MIQLVDRGPNDSIIRFSPRTSYKTDKTIECDLEHGYVCPYCNNVIMAMYYTENPINLDKYEETRVLSQGDKNEGDLLKIIPNWEDAEGNYRTEFYKTANGNAEKIVLKNHVINWKGAGSYNRKEFFEPGDRCCTFTTLISLRPENLIRDLASVSGYSLQAYNRYETTNTDPDVPFIRNWLDTSYSWINLEMRSISSIGTGVLAIQIKRKTLEAGFRNSVMNLYSEWDKKVAAELLAVV